MLKLYKKTVSLLLALIILLPSSTVVFADKSADYKRAENLLSGLNIVDKDEADVPVTRARFADIFAKAMNIYDGDFVPSNPFSDTQDSDYYLAIEILRAKNYISGVGDNNFAPENLMRVEDIARLYVCALGLEMYPESNNITFWTAANRLGLLKGVSYTGEITVHNLMIMTYNLLVEAPIGKMTFGSTTSKSFTLDSSTNLLYQNFKVLKETGTVSENSVSGVWSTSSVRDGYVKIKLSSGTVTALEGDTDISNYLGYIMDVYIEYGDDDNRVICYEEGDKNDTCVINIADISFTASTLSKIVYSTSGGSTRSASIASFPSVIYNGVYYDKGTFSISTLKNYEGTVTLIKSSGNGEYDIVKIVAYTDYFVRNVEYYDGEMRIFDKGKNTTLILNENESKIKVYHPNGAEASIYELQANMLLTVVKSADSENIIVYICDDAEAKGINSVKNDDRILVTSDGEEYRIAASFPIEDIELSKNTKIYFDHMGNVGWVETDSENGYTYAIVCSAKYKSKEDQVVLNTFVKAGEFTKFTLAPKVNIDGISYKNAQDQLTALNAISVKGFQTGYYPIRYILNEDGLIKNIDSPKYNKGVESKDSLKACLDKSKTTSGVLFSSDGILAKQFVLSSSAKVFVVPENASVLGNYNMYSSGGKSLLTTGKNTNVMAFQTKDNSMYVNLIVIWKEQSGYAEINHDNRLFLIDKIVDVYDESSDTIVKEVRGVEGGVEKVYRTYEEFDNTKLNGLSKGDVVRFAYFNGAIYNFQVVFQKDPTGATIGTYNRPSGSNDEDNNEGNYDMYYCGYVRSREGKFLKIWTADITKKGANVSLPNTILWKNSDTTSEEYRIVQANNIAVYDPNLGTGGKVYVGDIEDIPYYEGNSKYAIVIARYRSRSPQEIVVIKQ